MYEEKLIEAEAIGQKECFEAGQLFAKTEGIVPAPEATHAIASAIRAAKNADANSESIAVLTAMCCLLYTSPSPRDQRGSRMPSSA